MITYLCNQDYFIGLPIGCKQGSPINTGEMSQILGGSVFQQPGNG
jgi:hypothetical protein